MCPCGLGMTIGNKVITSDIPYKKWKINIIYQDCLIKRNITGSTILTNSTNFIIKILYLINSLHFLSTGTESENALIYLHKNKIEEK